MAVESALALIESISDFRVMFVGDTIVDEYHYVKPLGKSPKENLIPVSYESSEVFQGGVQAAANHLRPFCRFVTVRTDLSSVRKIRMVQKDYTRKLFEVQYQGDILPVPEQVMEGFDCVVTTDFGHGAVTEETVKWLGKAPYLAVNAQTNSANFGFNLITKYPRADYIVIDEPEARLAAQDRESPIERVIEKLAVGRTPKMVITHGSYGAVGYDESGVKTMPAFTNRVVDTMGAGDAFFSITAPMSKHGSIEDLLLIGNAAGALKTQIVGNREPVTKEALIGFLKNEA